MPIWLVVTGNPLWCHAVWFSLFNKHVMTFNTIWFWLKIPQLNLVEDSVVWIVEGLTEHQNGTTHKISKRLATQFSHLNSVQKILWCDTILLIHYDHLHQRDSGVISVMFYSLRWLGIFILLQQSFVGVFHFLFHLFVSRDTGKTEIGTSTIFESIGVGVNCGRDIYSVLLFSMLVPCIAMTC